jgi:hypothetical protein
VSTPSPVTKKDDVVDGGPGADSVDGGVGGDACESESGAISCETPLPDLLPVPEATTIERTYSGDRLLTTIIITTPTTTDTYDLVWDHNQVIPQIITITHDGATSQMVYGPNRAFAVDGPTVIEMGRRARLCHPSPGCLELGLLHRRQPRRLNPVDRILSPPVVDRLSRHPRSEATDATDLPEATRSSTLRRNSGG